MSAPPGSTMHQSIVILPGSTATRTERMLLDTSGLLCLLNPAERAHSQTRELIGTARSLMTHNYVLAELVALAHSRRMRRAPTLQFLSVMAARRLGKVVFVDSALHDD